VRRFQARYGVDRVTSDVIEAAYSSVYLWAQAVSEAESDNAADVLKTIQHQSLNAPEGIVSVDDETQHTWRPVHIGRIKADGQFDLVWTSGKPVRPIPYPSSRSRTDWASFLENLHRTWGGWANPGTYDTTRRAEDVPSSASCPDTTFPVASGTSLAQTARSSATGCSSDSLRCDQP
jgi:urea transport system substrate-binding protein